MKTQVIIALLGDNIAGKGWFCKKFKEYVAPDYTTDCLSTSGIIRASLSPWKSIPLSRKNMIRMFDIVEEEWGKEVMGGALSPLIAASTADFVIIDCLRTDADLEFIRSLGPFLAVYVTALQKLRWRRGQERDEKAGEKKTTFRQFKLEDLGRLSRDIPRLAKEAGAFVIDTSSPIEKGESDRQLREFAELYAKPRLFTRPKKGISSNASAVRTV